MTLLSVIQAVAPLLGVPRPTEVVASTDTQVQQLYALANEEGKELAKGYPWQRLTAQHTFTTVAADVQPGAVPADWEAFIPNTIFDRTTMREVMGPLTPQQWQSIQAQPQLNPVFLGFRLRGNDWLMTPTPTAGDTVAYEYITMNWVVSADDTPQPAYEADTDTALVSERLIELGIRWRFRKTQGLDYSEDFRTYEMEKQKVQSKDGGSSRLDVTGRTMYNIFGYPNVSPGNWPG